MNTVTVLAVISFLACVGLTFWSSIQEGHKDGQTVKDSLIEAWNNIAIGFSINYTANLFILPLVSSGVNFWDNFMIGWIYTAISMVRQFAIRRHHNARQLGIPSWFDKIRSRLTWG